MIMARWQSIGVLHQTGLRMNHKLRQKSALGSGNGRGALFHTEDPSDWTYSQVGPRLSNPRFAPFTLQWNKTHCRTSPMIHFYWQCDIMYWFVFSYDLTNPQPDFYIRTAIWNLIFRAHFQPPQNFCPFKGVMKHGLLDSPPLFIYTSESRPKWVRGVKWCDSTQG